MPEANALVKKEAGEVTAPEAMRGGIYYTPRVDIYESADEGDLCDYPAWTAIRFGFTRSCLGRWTVRTPSRYSAEIWSASISGAMAKDL